MGIDNDDGSKMSPVIIKDAVQREISIKSFSYSAYKRRTKWEEFKFYCNVALQRWDKLSFIHNRLAITSICSIIAMIWCATTFCFYLCYLRD